MPRAAKQSAFNAPSSPSQLMSDVKELGKLSVDDLVSRMFPGPKQQEGSPQNPPPPRLDDLSVDDLIRQSGVTIQTNDMTGDPLPHYVDGSSPQTPMNKSVLTAAERFKLSLGGDTKAKISFLKDRYEDAGLDTDGDFVVKKEGKWYSADAKEGFIGNIKNAFDLSANIAKTFLFTRAGSYQRAGESLQDVKNSEMVKDVAESVPLATNVVTQALAAYLTKGRSLLTQGVATGMMGGANSLVETSMGKIVGTYDGEPADQIQEAGMEFLLTAGGQTIIPGLGQAATKLKVVQALGEAGKNLSKLNPVSRASLADFASKTTGVGKNEIERYMARPAQVMAYVNKYSNTVNFEEAAFEEQIKLLTKAGGEARRVLTADYGADLGIISKEVGENFSLDVSAPAREVIKQMNAMGLVKFLPGKKSIVPVLRSQEEIADYFLEHRGSEALQAVAGKKDAYNLVKEFFDSTMSRTKELKPIKGEEAFKRYQQMDSALGNSLRDFRSKAKDLHLTSVMDEFSPLVKGMQTHLDTQIETNLTKLGKQDALTAYKALKTGYRESIEQADALLDVNDIAKMQGGGRQAARNKAASLITKLVGGGKLSRTKQALRGNMNEGIATLTDKSPELGRMFDKIKDIEAGYQFTPRLNDSFIKFGPIQVAVGATGAMLSGGDPEKLGTMGAVGLGAAVVTAPRTLLHVIGANKKMGQVLAKSMLMGKTNLARMTSAQRSALLNDPALLNTYQGTILNSVRQYTNSSEQLGQVFDETTAAPSAGSPEGQ